MYAGRIVETGEVGAIFREPRHPYNKALQRSIPAMQPKGEDLVYHPRPAARFVEAHPGLSVRAALRVSRARNVSCPCIWRRSRPVTNPPARACNRGRYISPTRRWKPSPPRASTRHSPEERRRDEGRRQKAEGKPMDKNSVILSEVEGSSAAGGTAEPGRRAALHSTFGCRRPDDPSTSLRMTEL